MAKKKVRRPLIGFIGQGYIGKNYADDFERRGFRVVRYALENGYEKNRELIKRCDIVFVAVPTPTTPKGFSAKIIREILPLVGKGKISVIKSTILPGTTKALQKENLRIIVLNSPEFLSEVQAARDAAYPFSNIVGVPLQDGKHKRAAWDVQAILPKAPFVLVCDSTEAEIIKYTHNMSGYVQIVFFNMMYDISRKLKCDWSQIEKVMQADPMICNRYAKPIHKSGRGAGGNCFIKDFAAFTDFYASKVKADAVGIKTLRTIEEKNKEILLASKKDLHLLEGVYGKRGK